MVQSSLRTASHELEWIIRENAGRGSLSYVLSLKFKLGVVKTLHLCKNKWVEDVRGEPALRILEDTILKHCPEIHSFYLRLKQEDDEEEWGMLLEYEYPDFLYDIGYELTEAMEVPFEILSDVLLQHNASSSSSSSHFVMWDLLNIIDSLLYIVPSPLHPPGVVAPTIRFLKNFILFASSFRGVLVRRQTTIDLFIHIEHSIVHVLCSILEDIISEEGDSHESMMLIEPLEPHVCGIYIGVLQELALQFSESSIIHPTPAGSHDHTPVVLQDFVDSLLFLLLKLLSFQDSSHQYLFRQQIRKLYNGLEFLKASMREHHDKKIGHHDHIPPVICAAGIIICYLFMEKEDEGGLVEKLEFLFSAFEEKFKLIKGVEGETPTYSLASASCFPQTYLLGFIDSLLEKMESDNVYEAHSAVASEKDKFQTIRNDLSFLRSFLVDVMQESNQNEKLKTLLGRIATVAYETEFALDSLLVGGNLLSYASVLHGITEEIKLIKIEASKTSHSKERTFQVEDVTKNDNKMPSKAKLSEFDEHVVGLDDETKNIVDQLTRGTGKLDIVSIVGMGGLGKTTLGKKVYRHPSIVHHFHVRSWCTISQVYRKKSLLFEILRGLDGQSADKYLGMNENDLAQKLYQGLKGKRYLIVLDDVWDVQAWNDLNNSFPDDAKGSRILLTSRYEYVALQIKRQSKPHHLRLLTDDESWKLFQMKVGIPSEHNDRGKAIVKRCKGLPLMIVVIAGLLSNMEPSSWEEVKESLSKGIDQCIDAIALSYSHLPPHLKLCFLYFGACAEDQKISVQEMKWLWIAEDLVQENGRDCIEDVAEGYMMDLIQRNLVMVDGIEFGSRVKFCKVHDLIHGFCSKKANKEQFLHRFQESEIGSSIEPSCILYRLRVCSSRVEDFVESRRLHCPRLRTLFFLTDHKESLPFLPPWYGILYKFCMSNLLGVLDLTGIFGFIFFPRVVLQLVRLRYLALSTGNQREMPSLEWEIPSSIEHLSNLVTFIVQGDVDVILPNTVWNLKKLRHLYRLSHTGWGWKLSTENPKCLSFLENLQIFSSVQFSCYQTMNVVIRKCPNIRILKCKLNLKGEDAKHAEEDLKIIALDCLSQLESLRLTIWFGDKLDLHFCSLII